MNDLPNRRVSVTFTFDHGGISYIATVGRFAEVFPQGGKTGSVAEITAHDASVTLSIALQSGKPAEAIRWALLKLPDGSAAGPLGQVLDLAETDGHGP